MIAVIFEVNPAQGQMQTYLDAAAALRPLLLQIDGFIGLGLGLMGGNMTEWLQRVAIMSTGTSNSPFMKFYKNYAMDGVSHLGLSIAKANTDLGYFHQKVEDLGTRAEIDEGTSHNLQADFDARLVDGRVPEIFDYFLKRKK